MSESPVRLHEPDPMWGEITALARDLKVSIIDNSANSEAPWARKCELVFPDKTVIAFSTPTEVLAFLKGVKHGRSAGHPRESPGKLTLSTCLTDGVGKVVSESHDWVPYTEPTRDPYIGNSTFFDFCRRCGVLRLREEFRAWTVRAR
jgi:hypothetical protein